MSRDRKTRLAGQTEQLSRQSRLSLQGKTHVGPDLDELLRSLFERIEKCAPRSRQFGLASARNFLLELYKPRREPRLAVLAGEIHIGKSVRRHRVVWV